MLTDSWRALQVVSQGTDFAQLATELRPYFTEATCEPGAVIIEVPCASHASEPFHVL